MSEREESESRANKDSRIKVKVPYAKVFGTFYERSKKRGWDTSTLVLAKYVIDCEHRRSEGIYRLPMSYILEDLPKGWGKARIRKTFAILAQDGFAIYDEDSSVVLLLNALKREAPAGPDQTTGALKVLAKLPETVLWPRFLEAAERYAPDFAVALRGTFPERQNWGQNSPQTPSCGESLGESTRETATPLALALGSSPTSELNTRDSSLEAQSSCTQDSVSSPNSQGSSSSSNIGSVCDEVVQKALASSLMGDEEGEEQPTSTTVVLDDPSEALTRVVNAFSRAYPFDNGGLLSFVGGWKPYSDPHGNLCVRVPTTTGYNALSSVLERGDARSLVETVLGSGVMVIPEHYHPLNPDDDQPF